MEEKRYEVKRIEGEYAYISDTESGEELFIAMALLPAGVDEGDIVIHDGVELRLK